VIIDYYFSATPFNQQQLSAWQPILTASTVLPTFFVIGIAFIAIGIGLLYFSDSVMEKSFDYTDCLNKKGEFCHQVIANNSQVGFIRHIFYPRARRALRVYLLILFYLLLG
jgi:hypothetical protein